jgi:1,4-dihydroxy-2-naphthoyl-CoA hydrolase
MSQDFSVPHSSESALSGSDVTPDSSSGATAGPSPFTVPDAMRDLLGPDFDPLGALARRMGIYLLEATAEQVVATMPVTGNTQPFGLLHGGASVVLAETLGSIGAAIHGLPTHHSVGLDINATHHRAATGGLVRGVATAVSLGRTIASYEVVVHDESAQRVCTARLTCLLRPIASQGA